MSIPGSGSPTNNAMNGNGYKCLPRVPWEIKYICYLCGDRLSESHVWIVPFVVKTYKNFKSISSLLEVDQKQQNWNVRYIDVSIVSIQSVYKPLNESTCLPFVSNSIDRPSNSLFRHFNNFLRLFI